MSGRCLSLATALLVLLRARNSAGAVVVSRTMHEANRLLEVFMDREETTLLARWLANEAISPGQVRDAVGRTFDGDNQQAQELGLDMGEHIEPIQASTEIYRVLSRSAHDQRSGLNEYFSPGLRRFAYRTAPEEQVAGLLATYEQTLVETILSVGRFLDNVNPLDYYDNRIRRMLAEILSVGEAFPLA